ncbi:MAG: Ger(x)C family spore germination protein [Thermicanus sp.]|nr:Ger(x)C family spore germination protein [Thermicanus sp.]
MSPTACRHEQPQQQLSQRIFLGHLRVIVISEKFARTGVEDIRDFLMRTPQIRKNAWLVVAKGPASLFLETTPELARVPALYILDTLDKAVEIGKLPPIYNGFFFSTVLSKGKEGVLPYLEINKKKGNVIIEGLALFRKEKMVGKTKPLEIGAFMEVESINPAGYDVLIPLEEGEAVSVVVLSRQSKIEVRRQGGKPKFRVKIYVEADLNEKLNPHFIIKDASILEKIEKAAEKEFEKVHKQMIKKTQRLKSDIFGFGEYVRAKLPDYWRKEVKTKERWEEIYPEVPIDVSVNLTLRRIGMQAR